MVSWAGDVAGRRKFVDDLCGLEIQLAAFERVVSKSRQNVALHTFSIQINLNSIANHQGLIPLLIRKAMGRVIRNQRKGRGSIFSES